MKNKQTKKEKKKNFCYLRQSTYVTLTSEVRVESWQGRARAWTVRGKSLKTNRFWWPREQLQEECELINQPNLSIRSIEASAAVSDVINCHQLKLIWQWRGER